MSAKNDLTVWVLAHARDADDAKAASKLIAAYVGECVRTDRAKQAASDTAKRREAIDSVLRGASAAARNPFLDMADAINAIKRK